MLGCSLYSMLQQYYTNCIIMIIGVVATAVTGVTLDGRSAMNQSHVRYLTVDECARILRMNPATIYRNLDDVPHERHNGNIIIPCEFLFMTPPPVNVLGKTIPTARWWQQMVLPFEIPSQRRWRNSGRLVQSYHYPLRKAVPCVPSTSP